MTHRMDIAMQDAPREVSYTLIFLGCMILTHACFQVSDDMADYQKARMATPWTPVTGTITQTDSIVQNGSHCDKVNVDYRYQGALYHSQVVFSPSCEMASPDIDYLTAVKNRYPVGHEYAVQINPAHPAESRDPSFKDRIPSLKLVYFSASVLFALGLYVLLLGCGYFYLPVQQSERPEDEALEDYLHTPSSH